MLGELVIVVIAASVVVAALSRPVDRRRQLDTSSAARRPVGQAWSAGRGPLEVAFPLERTPNERDVADAAFVDGLVIGRYLVPDPRTTGEHGDGGTFRSADPGSRAESGSRFDDGLDGGFDDGFDEELVAGFDEELVDGFDEELVDGFDDDW